MRRHQRIGLISCTVSTGGGGVRTAKSRLFEAIERSQQIGGPLARAAVATLLPKEQVGMLVADGETGWDSSNRVAVWGRDELYRLFTGDTELFEEWMA